MKKQLVQTIISASSLRKLDALARASGHNRASYLRHLIDLHVAATTPKLTKAIGIPSTMDHLDPLERAR